MDWKTVSVFISSTFNDMHAERDYLIKYVFPELSQWCEERRIRLVDIDLRWGVTSDESQTNNAVRKCLENIDECRPFFLCLIGQRRGWVPNDPIRLEHERNKRILSGGVDSTKYEISGETVSEYPELIKRKRIPDLQNTGSKDVLTQYRSVTEMEIEHALLEPMYRILDWDGEQRNVKHPLPCNALFLQRQDNFTDLLSPEHRLVYTNDELCIWGDDPKKADAAVDELIETVKSDGYEMITYSGQWDENVLTPELAAELNGSIISKGRLVFPRNFKDTLISRLQALILGTAGFEDRDDPATISTDRFQADLSQQEQFLHAVTDRVVGRDDTIYDLNDYLANDSRQAFLLSARAGYGKTTLLASFIKQASSDRLLYRFCGVSDLTTDSYTLWDTLCREAEVETPLSPDKLSKELSRLLLSIRQSGIDAIVIDAVDQMQNGLEMLNWFKHPLPDGLKLILSVKMDDTNKPLIDSLSEGGIIHHNKLSSLSDQLVQFNLIDNFLLHYMKALDTGQKKEMCDKNHSGNPLYLKIVLHELRRFGSFRQLPQEIEGYGSTPAEAFSKMLERMEKDSAFEVIDPCRLVPLVFGLLSCARSGLTESEIIHCVSRLLSSDADLELQLSELLPGSVRFLLRQVRPFIARRDGRVDYLFDSFKEAAFVRYSALHKSFNKALMDCFREECDPHGNGYFESDNVRALVELGFHTTEFDFSEGDRLFSSLAYLDARCNKSHVQLLLADMNRFESEICTGLSTLILRYQSLLSNYPNALFSICRAATSTPVRERAEAMIKDRSWVKPWLEVEQGFAFQQDGDESAGELSRSVKLIAESEQYVYNTGCAFSPDGALFVYSETLGHLKVFDTGRFELLSCFVVVHPVRVTSVKISHGNEYLAVAHEDLSVELFRLVYDNQGLLLQAVSINKDLVSYKPKRGACALGFSTCHFCYQPDVSTVRAVDLTTSTFTDIFSAEQPIVLDSVTSIADCTVLSVRQGMASGVYSYSNITKAVTGSESYDGVFVRCTCTINDACFGIALSDNRVLILDADLSTVAVSKMDGDVKSICAMDEKLMILCRNDVLLLWDWAEGSFESIHVDKSEERHLNELAITNDSEVLTILGASVAKYVLENGSAGMPGPKARIVSMDELPQLTAVVCGDDNTLTVQRAGFCSEPLSTEKNVKYTACLTQGGVYLLGEYGQGFFLASDQTHFMYAGSQGQPVRYLKIFSATDGYVYFIDNLWNLHCGQSGFTFDLSRYEFDIVNTYAAGEYVFIYGTASGVLSISNASTGHERLSGLLLIFQISGPGMLRLYGERAISEKLGKPADIAFQMKTSRIYIIFNTPFSSGEKDLLGVSYGTKEEWISGNESHKDINICRKVDANAGTACTSESYLVCYQGNVFAYDAMTLEYKAAIACDSSIDHLQGTQGKDTHALALCSDSTEIIKIKHNEF